MTPHFRTLKDPHFSFFLKNSALFVRWKEAKSLWLKEKVLYLGTISTPSEWRNSAKKLRTLCTQMNRRSIRGMGRVLRWYMTEMKRDLFRTWNLCFSVKRATQLTPTVKWMAIVVKTILLYNFLLTSCLNQLSWWTVLATRTERRKCFLENYRKENTWDGLQ